MSYKTIAIVISDEVGDKAALQAAVTLANREGGHLDVYCLGIDPMRYDVAPMGASLAVMGAGTGEAQARAATLLDWAQSCVKGALAPTAVQKLVVTSAGLDAAIARVVRYSDLIIASQPYGEGSTQLQTIILEAALFGTGAPVMMIPRTADDIGAFDRVMVAWDESTQALEAVRKALPVLKRADRAEIIMINPPSHSPERSDPGGVICVMLARHGVKADVSILAKTMPLVAEVINRHAQDQAVDLIVMGAYGHSRFREALIGGATRDMLETARVPILMAH
ncbi:universal stress protein A family protein [Octadecabacter antarcticus 307]|uniref:Universal stress protein A family protein n=1 Tax=Octadecabacter antarcticus 307 TaxID=391626 RepID=M9R373_9RHOB|nr:universal stress protein [Octadecabacter antarcticus]AGI66208.1 universal stress protein A family protein [Octadecabacter antarcticus 307]